MKVEASYTFPAPRERVWQILTDPNSVSRCIPGCERFELVGPDTYQTTVKVGIGPIKGSFTGRVAIQDKQAPHRCKLAVEASAPLGFVKGEGLIVLEAEADGSTNATCKGEAQVGGTLAAVGSRMLETAARMSLDQFFNALKAQL